jgi:hypothetical protein
MVAGVMSYLEVKMIPETPTQYSWVSVTSFEEFSLAYHCNLFLESTSVLASSLIVAHTQDSYTQETKEPCAAHVQAINSKHKQEMVFGLPPLLVLIAIQSYHRSTQYLFSMLQYACHDIIY